MRARLIRAVAVAAAFALAALAVPISAAPAPAWTATAWGATTAWTATAWGATTAWTATAWGAATPAAASRAAAADPTEEERWIVAPCATGALVGAHADNGWVVLRGSASPCGVYPPGASFVIAVLEPGQQGIATVSPLGWRTYRRSGVTRFGYALTRTPGTSVACLASGPLRVLGCAEVTIAAGGGIEFRPLPADDPRTAELFINTGFRSDEDTSPACGTCF